MGNQRELSCCSFAVVINIYINMRKPYYLFVVGAMSLIISMFSCSEERRMLAPELSNTIVDLNGDTVHLVTLSESDYDYVIDADANGVVTEKNKKWKRVGTNRFSGNILLWLCDEIIELDESNRICKLTYDGKYFNTGMPKREEYVISYEDDRVATVNYVEFEDGKETASYVAHYTWAHGNLIEVVREGSVNEIIRYSYSKKKNPLKIFFTRDAFSLVDYSGNLWGEFGYYGLGTENLPIVERLYQYDGKDGEPQLVSTKKINIELDENGLCRVLTYKAEGERAEKVTYKYE